MNPLILKNYAAPAVREDEVLRYAGMKASSPDVSTLLKKCLEEALPRLSYRVVHTVVPVSAEAGTVDFSFTEVSSAALCKNLSGCREAIFFAATVGIEPDRLIGKYGTLSPAKALMFQAIGAERIESLCNTFCEEMKGIYGSLRPRFSPGYGDLSLDFQREMFHLLDCPRKIGLSLNESLLMSPTKSVTAVIGIPDHPGNNGFSHDCMGCSLSTCQFRK